MRHVAMLPSLLTLGNFTCGLFAIVVCASSLHAHGLAQQARHHAQLLERDYTPAERPDLSGLSPDALAALVARAHPSRRPAIVATPDAFRLEAEGQARWADRLFLVAGLLIFAGMFFDMLDGRVARMTHSESRFGAELDSLADVCTFGLAPAAMVSTLWLMAVPPPANWYGQVLFFAAVYAACAALRLARYNVEIGTTDKNHFFGLPSPAAAGCVVSMALFCHIGGYLDGLWSAGVALLGDRITATELMARAVALYTLVVGFLMVTRLTFIHVMNKYMKGRKKFQTLVLAVFLLMLLVEYPEIMLFAAFNGYVVACLAGAFWSRRGQGWPGWKRLLTPSPAAPAAKSPENEAAAGDSAKE